MSTFQLGNRLLTVTQETKEVNENNEPVAILYTYEATDGADATEVLNALETWQDDNYGVEVRANGILIQWVWYWYSWIFTTPISDFFPGRRESSD